MEQDELDEVEDLAELESFLYSQVYHASSTPDPGGHVEPPHEPNNNPKSRHYQGNLRNSNSSPRNQSTLHNPLIVVNPVANYVALSSHKTQNEIENRRIQNRMRRKKRKQKKKFATLQKRIADVDKLIDICKNFPKVKEQQLYQKPTETSEVICLLDSDDDCIEVPQNYPLVFVSDRESEENDEDDCIVIPENHPVLCVSSDSDNDFVPVKTIKTEKVNFQEEANEIIQEKAEDVLILHSNEVLELSDDSLNIQNKIVEGSSASKAVKRKKNAKKLSEKISGSEQVNLTKQTGNDNNLTKDNNEMILPESNTNDFIESSHLENHNHTKFNFGLHGSDFNNREFIRPANPCETYETESSSTSDFLPALKPIVFNEIEFPKDDLFSEGNMDNFENLITPKRNNKRKANVCEEEIKKQATPIKEINQTSDSSSESDYDEAEDIQVNNSKKLPDLSSMEMSVVQHNTKASKKLPIKIVEAKVQSKKRKSKEIGDKEASDNTPRKKIKRKSKPVSTVNSIVEVDKDNVPENHQIEDPHIPKCTEESIEENLEPELELEGFQVIDEAAVEESVIEIESDREFEVNYSIHINTVQSSSTILHNSEETAKNGTKRQRFSDFWCTDKNEFYKKIVDITECNLEELRNVMPDDPSLWQILHNDRFPSNRRKKMGPRCFRCRDFGHLESACPNKRVLCNICGDKGHLYQRCPIKMCKECGMKANNSDKLCRKCLYYRNRHCRLCHVRGHHHDTCPDLWRRYHLTTKAGPLQRGKGRELKPSSQLWCSACAKSGHLENSCYKTKSPQSIMTIKCYDDIYNPNRNYHSEDTNSTHQSVNQDEIDNGANISLPQPNNQILSSETAPAAYGDPVDSNTGYQCDIVENINVNIMNSMNVLNGYYNSSIQQTMPLLNNPFIQALAVIQRAQANMPQIAQANSLPQGNSVMPQILQGNHLVRQESHGNQLLPQVPQRNRVQNDSYNIYRVYDPKLYKLIHFQPLHVVQEFLKNELIKLDYLKCDPVKLRSSILELEQFENSSRSSPLRRSYRELNMLIFGLHKYKDGFKHLQKLRSVLSYSPVAKLPRNQRRNVWDSYNYLFGIYKHDKDSDQLLQNIINRELS